MSDIAIKSQKIFDNARAYSKASHILNQKAFGDPSHMIQDMDLGLPSTVNAALALELHFKALYLLEKGEDFKVNGRHSHDFYICFKQLDITTKHTMEAIFSESLQNRDMTDVEKIEKASSVLIPRDLVGNLQVWNGVFVNIRYFYEENTKGMSMFFFPEIENSLLNSIFHLKPEWRFSTSSTWEKSS